jgi:hypothetical protein
MKTMINFLEVIALTGIISLFTGCVPSYYAPNAQNVPVFSEKGQGNGTFSFQFGEMTSGANIQGALAVSNHIGIMANYNHYSGQESSLFDNSDYVRYKCNMGELGIGYYYPFSGKFVFEAYGGIGGSRVNAEYSSWDGNGNGKASIGTTSYFIQPSIGFYKKHVQLAFSSRFRLLDFRDFNYSSGVGIETREDLSELDHLTPQWFFEPAFTFRVGGKIVKFQTQVGFSIITTQDYIFDYDPININFGIVFSLRGKKMP